MRTVHPALNQKTFANIPRTEDATDVMTIQGTVFKKNLAPVTAPIYALCEGFF